MQIRNRLTLLFIIIVALILTLSSIAIYYFSADFREDEFYARLRNKAQSVAKILIEVEEVDAELLKIIEKNNPGSLPNEKIVIIDYTNREMYSTDDSDFLKIDQDLINQIRLKGEIRFRQADHEVLGFLLAEKYDRVVAIAAATDTYGLRKLKFLRTILMVVFGVSIIVVLIAGRIYAGRALAPISKVVQQVENISATSLNSRVDEGNGTDEIARLARTFNQMLNRLETAFKTQKNFIANASHELRTPLTAISGQLEVVLMKSRTGEEYKEALMSVQEDINSLSQTANRLLMLAQASSEGQETNFTPFRIDDILWQSRTELLKARKDCNIQISFDDSLDDDQLTVKGNEQLIRTALMNLMDNGCKYSRNKMVRVRIRPAGKKSLSIEFTDKGIGISPNDLKHIFEPFYRGQNAVNIKGHGIGLSLVEKIILLHRGKISVDSKVNGGTTFSLILPTL